MRWAIPVLLLTGCSKLLGISDLSGPGTPDASVDAAVISRKLSGTVKSAYDSSAVPNARVAAIAPDAQVLAQTTTDATGAFTLQVATDGNPFDAELRVSDPAATPAYRVHHAFYGPFAADRDKLDVAIVTQAELAQIGPILGLPDLTGTAQVVVEIRNAVETPLAGYTVQAPLAEPRIYYSAGGIPSTSSSVTTTDGRAFLFACKLGNVTVTADGPSAGTRALSLVEDDIYEVILHVD